jgi:hypothetical protein
MARLNTLAWMGLAALALATGPAMALPTHDAPSLIVPVQDAEDMEVQRDLEPDEVPATKSGGEMVPAPDRAKDMGGGNVEDEELQRDLETGD